MRVPELKALARDRGLRNYSWMRKAELVALLQNNPPPGQSRASTSPTPLTRSPPPPPQRHTAHVTLKLDDNGCCRIHSISDDGPGAPQGLHGNGWIVTDERYVLCPGRWLPGMAKIWGCWLPLLGGAQPQSLWAMTLTEAVDSIFSQ